MIAVVLVAAVVGGAWAIWHLRAPAAASAAGAGRRFDPNAKPAPVAVATAKSSDFNVYLNALGTVTARATVTVRSRVDGPLVHIRFHDGDMVKAGQLLAEIDPRTFAVQVAQANAQLAKDRALLANAQIDLDRYKTLLAQDSIASQQVDTQASLVRQYQATIASDQAQVDSAKLQLSFTRVTAPISGRLGLRQVDVGNMVHTADTNGIVVITEFSPIDVVFSLPESDLQQVLRRMKNEAALPVDALSRDQSKRLASGKLLAIDNQIDTSTGTVKLKARFANDDSALFPNQFVNVRMLVDTLHDATVVPSAAIQRGTQGTFVYVVGDDRAVAVRVVHAGPVNGESTVIDKGIVPGEIVVIDGMDRLREGQKVETVSRDTTVVPTGAPRQRRGAGNGQRQGAARRDGNASGTAAGEAAHGGNAAPARSRSPASAQATQAPPVH